MKKIFWDIETSDLNADWGTIFCIGYQIEGEPVRLISITDFPGWKQAPWNDKQVIQEFVKVLEREDIGLEVTHYGTNFDIPFLQARMLYHDLGVFPLLGHTDTYYIAKSKLKIKSRALGNVAEHAHVKYKKTPIHKDYWRMAARGDEEALGYVAKHCIADIRVLRAVYEKIGPMLRKPPVINDYGNCHVCGLAKLQRRGYTTTTAKGRQQRFQCQNCGAWSSRPEKKSEANGQKAGRIVGKNRVLKAAGARRINRAARGKR